MAFLNEFKEIFNKAAQSVTSKTKDSVEISRLSGESRSIAGELATLYEQIGRCYVDSKGSDLDALEPLCARVEELRERLEELERQRMQLKNQNRCPACGAVMPKNARFCSSCGRRMPEEAPEQESAPVAAEASYCPECGAMRGEGDAFCDVCGYNYAGGEAETPATSATGDAYAGGVKISPARPAPAAPADDGADEAPTDFEAD